jgi:mannose-6-phosphate isomerase-like protein (cupin superfamily)
MTSARFTANLDGPRLAEFAVALAAERHRWEHLVRHDRDSRFYAEIFSDAHVSAWLICWTDDQDTGFHDHDRSSGGVAVVAGRVREERLVLGGPPVAKIFVPGECFHFDASTIHRVRHTGAEPAVTMHAYSPPLLRMGAYSAGPTGELVRETLAYTEELRGGGSAVALTR